MCMNICNHPQTAMQDSHALLHGCHAPTAIVTHSHADAGTHVPPPVTHSATHTILHPQTQPVHTGGHASPTHSPRSPCALVHTQPGQLVSDDVWEVVSRTLRTKTTLLSSFCVWLFSFLALSEGFCLLPAHSTPSLACLPSHSVHPALGCRCEAGADGRERHSQARIGPTAELFTTPQPLVIIVFSYISI